ncbi:alpha/beta fold hydrolase [Streptomyces sp. INA 01156]
MALHGPYLGACGFRVYAPDLPSYGLTEDPTNHYGYGLGGHVDFVHDFVRQVGVDEFHLAGNSMGCSITAQYVVTHPEQVLSFALIAGRIGDLVSLEDIRRADGRGSKELPHVAFDGTEESMRAVLTNITYDPSKVTDDVVAMRTLAASKHADTYAKNLARVFGPQDGSSDPNELARLTTRGRLDKVTIPGIYLYGRQDVVFRVEAGYLQEDALPNVQFSTPTRPGTRVRPTSPTSSTRSSSSSSVTDVSRGRRVCAPGSRTGVRPFLPSSRLRRLRRRVEPEPDPTSRRNFTMTSTEASATEPPLVQRARRLYPSIAERAADVEKQRYVHPDSIDEMIDAGLTRGLQSAAYGGAEANPAEFYQAVSEIAKACTSTGWILMVLGVHTWEMAHMSKELNDELFGDDPTTLISSSYNMQGNVATKVPGGYRLTGSWKSSSGILHSSWVALGANVEGEPAPYNFVIPAKDVKSIDDWHVLGLAGTGSRSVVVEDVFIPEHRAIDRDVLRSGFGPGLSTPTRPCTGCPSR